jgi:hypothetical protein
MSTPAPGTEVDPRLTDKGTTKNSSEAGGTPLGALAWPVRTDQLSLLPATRDDLEATWRFRRLVDVSRWLTRAPASLEEYAPASRATPVSRRPSSSSSTSRFIGDLMLQIEDGWDRELTLR